MFHIVNNKIYMSRGETPTFKTYILDIDGAPYRVSSGIGDVVVSFTIRDNIWATGDNYSFAFNAIYSSELLSGAEQIHTFDDLEVGDYNDLYDDQGGTGTVVWDNTIIPEEISETITTSNLYKLTDINGNSTYRYYDSEAVEVIGSTDYKWIEYDFIFGFTFPYEATKALENKTYYYDIILYSGTLNADFSDGFPLANIDFKKQLLSPTDFIVGGSLNE